MLALPLRLSLRPPLFGSQNRLVTSLSQRSVLFSPRNVSRNGSDLNASETGTVKANDLASLSLPKDSPLSGTLLPILFNHAEMSVKYEYELKIAFCLFSFKLKL